VTSAPTERERSTFDWERAYASLDEMRLALEEREATAGPEARRLLERRARELARREPEAEGPVQPLDVVGFALGGARYAVPASCVQGVLPLREVTRVPCTPACILGVVNHRGRILAVVDLRELPETAGQASLEPRWLLAVESGGAIAFALAADEVEGIGTVAAETLHPAPSGPGSLVRGVFEDLVALLDVEAIARSPQIIVDDEGI
jgi:purine-binding chemotaxis protein CheW